MCNVLRRGIFENIFTSACTDRHTTTDCFALLVRIVIPAFLPFLLFSLFLFTKKFLQKIHAAPPTCSYVFIVSQSVCNCKCFFRIMKKRRQRIRVEPRRDHVIQKSTKSPSSELPRTRVFCYSIENMSSYSPKQPQKYKTEYSPTHRLATIKNSNKRVTLSNNSVCRSALSWNCPKPFIVFLCLCCTEEEKKTLVRG